MSDFSEQEALYEKVKASLSRAERLGLAQQKLRHADGKHNQYGHDLFNALRQAEFNRKTELAAAYLAETDDNLFAALGHLVRACLNDARPTRSGETQEALIERALRSELDRLPREVQRAARRRTELDRAY